MVESGSVEVVCVAEWSNSSEEVHWVECETTGTMHGLEYVFKMILAYGEASD